MATMTFSRSWIWIVAAAMLLAGILMLPVMIDHLPPIDSALSAHAINEHGNDATTAKQCSDEQQPGYLFFNPDSQRWAVVCWLGDRWGIVILTATWLVITAYVTSKLKTLEKMRKYMQRQGYKEQ